MAALCRMKSSPVREAGSANSFHHAVAAVAAASATRARSRTANFCTELAPHILHAVEFELNLTSLSTEMPLSTTALMGRDEWIELRWRNGVLAHHGCIVVEVVAFHGFATPEPTDLSGTFLANHNRRRKLFLPVDAHTESHFLGPVVCDLDIILGLVCESDGPAK